MCTTHTASIVISNLLLCSVITACRPELPPEVQKHLHAPKSTHVRVLSVIACAKAWVDDAVNYDEALGYLKGIEQGYAFKAISSHHRAVMQKIWEHFTKQGDVALEPRSGRPPKCPASVTDLGLQAMHHGRYREEVAYGDKKVTTVTGYSTMAEMVCDHPEVAAALEEHNLTVKQLYNAMVRQDPTLIRHAVTFKYEHDTDELSARKKTAADLLGKCGDIWAASRMVLDRMVFIDEGGFALKQLEKGTHKVWIGKEDLKSCDVVHLPWVEGHKDCNVHFIVAVCSHPAFSAWNGVVFYEKTTGTTDIRRSVNTRGQTAIEAFEYMVSYIAWLNMMLPYASVVISNLVHKDICRFTTCWNPMVLNPAVNTSACFAAAVENAAKTMSGCCRFITCTLTTANSAPNALQLHSKSRIATSPRQLCWK